MEFLPRLVRRAPLLALLISSLLPLPRATASDQPAVERAPLPVLTAVSARHVGDVDRVIFRFSGGVPASVHPAWVDTLAHDGSGLPVRVAGTKVLAVYMNGALAHDQDGSTVPGRTTFVLPNVITAVGAGDFEGTVSFGLGVQKKTSYTVTTKAHRVVVDVAAAFRTHNRKVWFVDQDAFASGQEPYVRPVLRPVDATAPAAGVLHWLFAGPTAAERADGLRLVRSRAWGFTDLSISDSIARVRLTRACGSGGSTLTVAAEIVPTLKQFNVINWVKIYGPSGNTESPSGFSDSIPACLEP